LITNSGIQIYPGCGRAPTPEDIAVGMCRITRYAGAIWCPLAAHSILVAEYAWLDKGTDEAWAWGLLHDAHETITGEVTRHWKPKEMSLLERELDGVMFKAFGLDVDRYRKEGLGTRSDPGFVKGADEKALCIESLTLGLKNWPEYYRKQEGRDIPALTPMERQTGERILAAWRSPAMVEDGSPQSRRLGEAFAAVKTGMLDRARATIAMSSSFAPMR
jgi:hypothetical protein